jgi:hypothetical protein
VRGGPVDALLTKPWTPRVPGGEPQRYFVARDERDISGELNSQLPRLELHYADGRAVVWLPPGFKGRR